MASLKSSDSSKGINQDASSDNSDDDKSQLCPGFKDVDSFVKVSEQTTQGADFLCVG